MSKTQLQTNNAKLSTLIVELQNKIAGEGVPEKKAFSLCTWEEVSQICKAGLASEYWALGDTKNLITGDSSTAMRIIGFDHDTVSDPVAYGREKAGITLEMVYGSDALKKQLHTSTDSSIQWTDCDMRNTTLSGYLTSTVPEEVKNVLVPVEKEYMNKPTNTILTVRDTLFLLSLCEVKGAPTSGYGSEGEQYAYYAAGNSAVKYDANGAACIWWTRSPYAQVDITVFTIKEAGAQGAHRISLEYNAFPCMCI